ncbi:MAG: 3-phosphoshikimate 1-carboxyvinyltransferase [Chitinophagaceae bacterium]
MQAIVAPSSISGSLVIPASKSAMQRACAAALIHPGTTVLTNPGISADDKAALDIIQQLGASVTYHQDVIEIVSAGIQPRADTINCGESGLSVRMFTSIAATASNLVHITGSGSLLKRPLVFFDQVLPLLGVDVKTNNGNLPLSVEGPLQCRNVTVDGSLSSQYITGLLFAFSAAGATDVSIVVRDLNSRPYVDLTLNIMRHFGLKTPLNRQYADFYFDGAAHPAAAATICYRVESDWSSASFFLVAGAVCKEIELRGLDLASAQADRAVLQALIDAGAQVSITDEAISVAPATLKAFHFNATQCPDLFPPLVALAAYCNGTTVIEGVHRLAHKESNRALTLQEEFAKLGITITLQDDLMMIQGGTLKGNLVHSRHDHRIAMACAIAALRAQGVTTINEAEAVNKSYPQFWEHLQQLNATVSLNDNNY